MERDFYAIDLSGSRPRIGVYPIENVKEDMKHFGVRNAADLQDPDWRIFRSEREARDWLSRFNETLRSLDNKRICQDRTLPNLLSRRRHIVTSILGDKCFTERRYNKAWRPGTLFNLYDQTYFLTVRLIEIRQLKGGAWRYVYELP